MSAELSYFIQVLLECGGLHSDLMVNTATSQQNNTKFLVLSQSFLQRNTIQLDGKHFLKCMNVSASLSVLAQCLSADVSEMQYLPASCSVHAG